MARVKLRATEEDVYVCTWSATTKGVTVQVKGRRDLVATGPNYDDACDRLVEVIQDAGGAMMACLEFDPPLPRNPDERRYSVPPLVTVHGNDYIDIAFMYDTTNDERGPLTSALFARPLCRHCGRPRAGRNDQPLMFASTTPCDAALGRLGGGVNVEVFSERFLGLLTREERNSLELRQVSFASSRRSKAMYELLGPAGPSRVAIRGRPPTGWRCRECHGQTFNYWSRETTVSKFVGREDLPDPLPSVFTIGAPPEVELCMTAERWSSLIGRPGTKGLTTMNVGVVPPGEVVRSPRLKPR